MPSRMRRGEQWKGRLLRQIIRSPQRELCGLVDRRRVPTLDITTVGNPALEEFQQNPIEMNPLEANPRDSG
jgi:hypothetical protein